MARKYELCFFFHYKVNSDVKNMACEMGSAKGDTKQESMEVTEIKCWRLICARS